MDDQPIVKYNGQWWVLKKTENEMAILWRNGERALVHLDLIEFKKEG